MKISISSPLPEQAELMRVLNDTFSPRYSFRMFGIGKEKTIMARKSSLVGLQMSSSNGQINFQPTIPNIAGSAIVFMMMTELAVLLILPFLLVSEGFRKDPYKDMAKEIGLFLKKKYRQPE